jgi:hypothetical protein
MNQTVEFSQVFGGPVPRSVIRFLVLSVLKENRRPPSGCRNTPSEAAVLFHNLGRGERT